MGRFGVGTSLSVVFLIGCKHPFHQPPRSERHEKAVKVSSLLAAPKIFLTWFDISENNRRKMRVKEERPEPSAHADI